MSGILISVYRRQAIRQWVTSSKGYHYSNKPAHAQTPVVIKGLWIVRIGRTTLNTISDVARGY